MGAKEAGTSTTSWPSATTSTVVAPRAGRAQVITLSCGLVLSVPSAAQTHVSGNLTQNATWTLAGNPYVVDSNFTVAVGVTLVIEPGVVVKVVGQTTQFTAAGILEAVGTELNPITFTSIQDDDILGDTGGDGPTTGAPGQWSNLRVTSQGTANLQHCVVRYSGAGSANHAYGGLKVEGYAFVSHCAFTSNQRSGMLASPGSTLRAQYSTFTGNAIGFSASHSDFQVVSSLLALNSDMGIHLNYTSNYVGAKPELRTSTVADNGNYGVYMQVYGNVSPDSTPAGHENNILGNGGDSDERQLFSLYLAMQADWTENYWGPIAPAVPCPWAPTYTQQIHLAYDVPAGGYCVNPGKGPVSNTLYLQAGGCPNYKPAKCAADMIKNDPYSLVQFDNGGW